MDLTAGGTGGRDAFGELVAREHAGLVATAAMITGSRAAAEEIVQDALERTFARWSSVSRLDRPGAWVRRVVVNASISSTRRSHSERRALERLRNGLLTTRPAEPEVPRGELWQAVRDLPDNQATAVALHYGADLPIAEVATEMGLGESAVKALLYRARQALRQAPELEELV